MDAVRTLACTEVGEASLQEALKDRKFMKQLQKLFHGIDPWAGPLTRDIMSLRKAKNGSGREVAAKIGREHAEAGAAETPEQEQANAGAAPPKETPEWHL